MSPFEDVRAQWAAAARPPARLLLRSVWTPTHSEYLNAAHFHTSDPDEFLRALLEANAVAEAAVLPEAPAQEYAEVWQVDRAVRQFLWSLVRSTRPERVLETGVADGASTRVVLDALEANHRGNLFSVDIESNVGRLARESSGAARWHLTVLPSRRRSRALRALFARVRPLDIFVHDSDHSYPWQRFEYREAWNALAPGGWLLSDDANASYALLDLSRSVGAPLWILSQPRKLFGLVRKGK